MCHVMTSAVLPIGDHKVHVYLQYPVHSSKYYK